VNEYDLAVHESGHAVASIALGGHCDYMSIVPEINDEARASVGGVEEHFDKGVVNFAGPVAELIAFPDRAVTWRTNPINWGYDCRMLLSEARNVRENQLNFAWRCEHGTLGGCFTDSMICENPAVNSFEASVLDNEKPGFRLSYSQNRHNTMVYWLLTGDRPLLTNISDQDAEDLELLDLMFRETTRLLKDNFDLVTLLAGSLEEHKWLDAEQIQSIIN
jgi:hypothetical protein